jgi:hypothetical protein
MIAVLRSSPRQLVLFGIVGLFGASVLAASEPCPGCPQAVTAQELKRLSLPELDQLFAAGRVGELPVGLGRGRVLLVVTAKSPHVRACLNNVVWKGKYFYPDGRFTNQWACFRAIESRVTVGPSWLDGQPAVVLEYPPGTAVFGNARDELREVAPGVILGRFYERCPCPRLQGYFVLEMDCAAR